MSWHDFESWQSIGKIVIWILDTYMSILCSFKNAQIYLHTLSLRMIAVFPDLFKLCSVILCQKCEFLLKYSSPAHLMFVVFFDVLYLWSAPKEVIARCMIRTTCRPINWSSLQIHLFRNFLSKYWFAKSE